MDRPPVGDRSNLHATGSVARAMWQLFEPVHAVAYFVPGAREPLAEAGYRGFWRCYFAARLAPLGQLPPAAAVAVLYTFAPHMVERAVPEIWSVAAPEVALRARVEGAGRALGGLLDDAARGDLQATLDDLEQVVEDLDCVGRPLAAANRAVPASDDPVERLWQLCTVLREHRGDGHLAALVLHGLGGCQALAWRCAVDLSREVLQPARGWTDEDWRAALDDLVERGLTDGSGTATEAAHQLLLTVESLTDQAAESPWLALGDVRTAALRARLGRIVAPLRGLLPTQNAIGLNPSL